MATTLTGPCLIAQGVAAAGPTPAAADQSHLKGVVFAGVHPRGDSRRHCGYRGESARVFQEFATRRALADDFTHRDLLHRLICLADSCRLAILAIGSRRNIF